MSLIAIRLRMYEGLMHSSFVAEIEENVQGIRVEKEGDADQSDDPEE